MITRIITGLILAPVFFVFLIFLPTQYLAVMLAGITAIASGELLRATMKSPPKILSCLTALAAVTIPIGYFLSQSEMITRSVGMLLVLALFLVGITKYDTPHEITFETILICYFGGVIYPAMLSSLVLLKQMEQGVSMVLLPVLIAFGGDTGAYFVGMTLGRHRGVTKVSPNKSLEGYIGGVVFGVITMALYGVFLEKVVQLQVNTLYLIVYGLVGAVVTAIGDLSFSLVKRQKKIKDFGALIPGHGGMLDRFDSMSFTAPMIVMLVEFLPAF